MSENNVLFDEIKNNMKFQTKNTSIDFSMSKDHWDQMNNIHDNFDMDYLAHNEDDNNFMEFTDNTDKTNIFLPDEKEKYPSQKPKRSDGFETANNVRFQDTLQLHIKDARAPFASPTPISLSTNKFSVSGNEIRFENVKEIHHGKKKDLDNNSGNRMSFDYIIKSNSNPNVMSIPNIDMTRSFIPDPQSNISGNKIKKAVNYPQSVKQDYVYQNNNIKEKIETEKPIKESFIVNNHMKGSMQNTSHTSSGHDHRSVTVNAGPSNLPQTKISNIQRKNDRSSYDDRGNSLNRSIETTRTQSIHQINNRVPTIDTIKRDEIASQHFYQEKQRIAPDYLIGVSGRERKLSQEPRSQKKKSIYDINFNNK